MMNHLQRAGLFLFIVLLPWQTHYVVREGIIAGGHSEYLTVKLFAVDFLLVALAGLAFFHGRPVREIWRKLGIVLIPFLGVAFLSVYWAREPYAAFTGWLRLVEGAVLLFVIARTRVTLREVLAAFVGSAVVQSGFALWQFFAQSAPAFTWLGLAAHNPNVLGTPVVIAGGERVLRAFGAFSHPNILGGFLALALLASVWLLAFARTSWQRAGIFLASVVLVVGLFVSFSRGAWIAAGVGAAVMLLIAWRQQATLVIDLGLRLRRHIIPLFTVLLVGWTIVAIAFAGLTVSFSDLVVRRVSASGRVEERSLGERAQFTKDAWAVFKRHWVAGVGLGNITRAVYEEVDSGRAAYDYQPPPNVFLTAAAELGIFGALIFALLIIEIVALGAKGDAQGRGYVYATISALFVLALLDHYLWTIPNGIFFFWFTLAFLSFYGDFKPLDSEEGFRVE